MTSKLGQVIVFSSFVFAINGTGPYRQLAGSPNEHFYEAQGVR
jgi:hypothetical protein